MTLAIGRLVDPATGGELGTVFAVTDRLALTAFHCLGERHTGKVETNRVRCMWDQEESEARVEDGDPVQDVALLRLDRRLPPALETIRLTRVVTEHSPFAAPGSVSAVREVRRFAVTGEIAWPQGRLPDGTPAIQLTCDQSLAKLPLDGLSGAPVLVGPSRMAVGLVRWNPPSPDDVYLAAGASVFAAPSAAVLDRWPELDTDSLSGYPDPRALLRRLAKRGRTRDAATTHADVRGLLLTGDLGIDEHDVTSVAGGSPREGHRFEIDIGRVVIEVRSDLRVDGVVTAAEHRLRAHLSQLRQETGMRYVGLLVDGAEWRLYHLCGDELRCEEILTVSSTKPKADELLSWLESVLATKRRIRPTPEEIESKLGASSPSYALDAVELAEIYERCRDLPTVRVKRAMWAKLLTTASGTNFADEDKLFVDHTLLVAMAEVIGHALMGFRLEDPTISAATIMSGKLFTERSQIGGVVEADFFDWVAEVPGGDRFVKDLTRRLVRFDWDHVEHDVLKVLYESIIPEEVRHRLGEYYTPDWLAEALIEECVTDPLSQRVLDASCGSGTFLFHAVRRYVSAAEAVGNAGPEIVRHVREHVVGFDVHPVAVTLARVTYLLAIGKERIRSHDRPGFVVPVYLGDSLRWGEEKSLLSDDGLNVPTVLDQETFLSDPNFTQGPKTKRLRFPESVVADADRFDRFVTELADKATERPPGGPRPSLRGTLRRFGIEESDRAVLEQTFQNMCDLHDQGKDHIWGYYVRNQARPAWLARPDNRVDVLIGNPPWLAYRYMTQLQQKSFRAMCKERGLWAGASVATNQDLAALFVVRCIELYLKEGGRFGYVMPRGALFQQQYRGFRMGQFTGSDPVTVAFERPWDFKGIKRKFFRQSVGVVLGRRRNIRKRPSVLDQTPEIWWGDFDSKRASWCEASAKISRMIGEGGKSLS